LLNTTHKKLTKIVIVEYDPSWAELYKKENDSLDGVFSAAGAVIEHVGSTAVEGLGAKPIVDIMVGLDSLNEMQDRMDELAALGYEYVPEYEAEVPERRFFRKTGADLRKYHLHCVCRDTGFFHDHILFRDSLRSDEELASEYLKLKRNSAAWYPYDRLRYNESKTDLIKAALAEARKTEVTG
jgi:GrpB-like predicted nucleotidyltransferase (UPF0157 family)